MKVAIVDVDTLAGNWWAVLLRGVAGILFGVVTFFAPGVSLAALVILFGAYTFTDGVFAIVAAVRRSGTGAERWWLLLVEGVAGIAAGLVTFFIPGITALVLLYLIAAWAFVTGAFEIAAAIRLRKAIEHEWLLVLSGVLSVALGVLLMLFPAAGALALVIWIGAYALVSGALFVALGFRLRSFARPGRRYAAHAMA
ncbi:MAG TPA: HdeD family acid-resistance protein, partial [Solirubrobacteraceae bacterium]|nr:HdeD family acid-resistance protein [Solirubrobacteraceae bacterium]